MELYFYLNIIFLPLGIFINVIQTYVFCSKSLNSKTRIGFMHSLLSFFNLLQLTFALITQIIFPLYFGINVYEVAKTTCVLLNFAQQMSYVMPSFQQVLISFQFYLSIKFPNSYLAYQKSKTKFFLTTMLLILFAFFGNLEYFFYDLKTEPALSNFTNTKSYLNEIGCNASFNLLVSSQSLALILRYILPFILLNILNFLIIYQVCKNQLKLNRSLKSYKDFFLSILIINFGIFIFFLPWSTAIIIQLANKANLNVINAFESSVDYFYKIGYSITFLVCILPFFVYLKFNRLFRKEFFEIFAKSKRLLVPKISVNTISLSKSGSSRSRSLSKPN